VLYAIRLRQTSTPNQLLGRVNASYPVLWLLLSPIPRLRTLPEQLPTGASRHAQG
jgi:hypothetical protein